MIEVGALRFSYPDSTFRLEVDDFRVEQGQAIALVGPSGSGKTTFLYLLAGILTPRSGTIRVGDFTVSGASDESRRRFRIARIGFVFQELHLLDYLDVRENIALPIRLDPSRALDSVSLARIVRLAERVGIADKLSRFQNALSQGERQRVAICRALVSDPVVIFADEPTSSLDVSTSATTLSLMLELVREHRTTLLMLTHDESLLGHFDRVVRLPEFSEMSTR